MSDFSEMADYSLPHSCDHSTTNVFVIPRFQVFVKRKGQDIAPRGTAYSYGLASMKAQEELDLWKRESVKIYIEDRKENTLIEFIPEVKGDE